MGNHSRITAPTWKCNLAELEGCFDTDLQLSCSTTKSPMRLRLAVSKQEHAGRCVHKGVGKQGTFSRPAVSGRSRSSRSGSATGSTGHSRNCFQSSAYSCRARKHKISTTRTVIGWCEPVESTSAQVQAGQGHCHRPCTHGGTVCSSALSRLVTVSSTLAVRSLMHGRAAHRQVQDLAGDAAHAHEHAIPVVHAHQPAPRLHVLPMQGVTMGVSMSGD